MKEKGIEVQIDIIYINKLHKKKMLNFLKI